MNLCNLGTVAAVLTCCVFYETIHRLPLTITQVSEMPFVIPTLRKLGEAIARLQLLFCWLLFYTMM